jgi:hypothetical protein
MKKFYMPILGIILWVGFSGFELHAQENGLKVAEAKLGRGVVERQIVDEDSVFSLNERVYLWLKITNGASDTIAVTWELEDYSFTYILHIGGNPWRTWAYKTVWKKGEWTVRVTDGKNILNEMTFMVKEEMKVEKKEDEEKIEKTE